MRIFGISFLLLLLSLSAFALGEDQVRYVGGTNPGMVAGVTGRLDTTGDSSLVFEHAGNKLAIPYSCMQSHRYSKEVARHLGVLPAIVVGMLKTRQYRHFFRISYRDQANIVQVAIFQVSKQNSPTIQAVLDSRSPHAVTPCADAHGLKPEHPRDCDNQETVSCDPLSRPLQP